MKDILAHEVLGHAYDRDKGIEDSSTNPETGVKRREESAIKAENEYRKADDKKEREKY